MWYALDLVCVRIRILPCLLDCGIIRSRLCRSNGQSAVLKRHSCCCTVAAAAAAAAASGYWSRVGTSRARLLSTTLPATAQVFCFFQGRRWCKCPVHTTCVFHVCVTRQPTYLQKLVVRRVVGRHIKREALRRNGLRGVLLHEVSYSSALSCRWWAEVRLGILWTRDESFRLRSVVFEAK